MVGGEAAGDCMSAGESGCGVSICCPVNTLGFCKRLLGNIGQRLKNDGYENHL